MKNTLVSIDFDDLTEKHNFIYNLWFGSTPDEVIKRSKIPVLVIPEDH